MRFDNETNQIPDWIFERNTLDALAISTRPCIVSTPGGLYCKTLGFQSMRLYLPLTANTTLESPYPIFARPDPFCLDPSPKPCPGSKEATTLKEGSLSLSLPVKNWKVFVCFPDTALPAVDQAQWDSGPNGAPGMNEVDIQWPGLLHVDVVCVQRGQVDFTSALRP